MATQRILLVEGKDDKRVLRQFCESRGIPRPDKVIALGGDHRLLENLSVRLKANDDRENVIGVVIDADTDVAARWQSLRDRLIGAGYVGVPALPDAGGIVREPPTGTLLPRVGVWIMPDNRTGGNLEDFLAFLVPQPNELFDHAEKSIDTIPNPPFREATRSKALIHTWLAWQSDPGLPMGTAIGARFLDSDLPEANALAGWLGRLFGWDDGSP